LEYINPFCRLVYLVFYECSRVWSIDNILYHWDNWYMKRKLCHWILAIPMPYCHFDQVCLVAVKLLVLVNEACANYQYQTIRIKYNRSGVLLVPFGLGVILSFCIIYFLLTDIDTYTPGNKFNECVHCFVVRYLRRPKLISLYGQIITNDLFVLMRC